MSPTDVEVVRRAFETFNAEGTEAIMPFMHSEIEFTTPPDLASEPDTYSGHDGVRRYFDSFFEVMDRVQIEAEALEDGDGGRVLATWDLRARGRSTGIETTLSAVGVVTVRDGLIVGISFHPDRESALSETRINLGR